MQTTARNLVELYLQSSKEYSTRPVLGTRLDDGWHWTTYGELASAIDRVRGGLARLGVGPGDRIGIISSNRFEWPAVLYAAAGLEAVPVPMYEAQRREDWKFILADSGAVAVVCSKAAIVDQLEAMRAELPALRHIIGFDLPADHPGSYAALTDAPAAEAPPPVQPGPDALAEIVYTSGTTGRPKGVMLTHGNITADVRAMQQVIPLLPDDRTVSFLPWAHVMGQIGELHNLVSAGLSTALNADVTHLVDDLREVRPTLLVAVPSIFNRVYQQVLKRISERPRPVQRMFWSGVAAASQRSHGQPVGPFARFEIALDDRLIFSRIRDQLGGQLRSVFSGGAALSREVGELIDALGITVLEGYGLTETSCTATLNPPDARRLGTAGKPLPGVRIEIDPSVGDEPPSGEIIVYGPIVMQGYFNRPRDNQEVFTADGGLRTGDLGYIDQDGYLVVTGRIKELFKLENGKYVMPVPLEEAFKLSPFIRDVMVCGANRPYGVAVAVPDAEALAEWARRENHALDDVARDPAVRALIAREIDERAQPFPAYARPRRLAVVSEEFSAENGMLTPTLKLRRKIVAARYAAEIEDLYRADESAATAGDGERGAPSRP